METSNMLILTDFSNAALNAARYAAALAYQLKTPKLILYHSFEPAAIPPIIFVPLSEGFTDSLDESNGRITELKNDLQDWLPEQTKIETLVDDRALVPAVNTLIGQYDIGLVVAGITGKSNLEKILIGSNTIGLAKNGQAPLLIVPPVAAFQPIKTIVFAGDLKQVSEPGSVFAIKTFVHALGARLILLNVDDYGKHSDADNNDEMAALHEIWGSQVEYHYIDHNDTVAGIMEFAGQQRAELVITILKEHSFFENIFHRSMTTRLAYHTHLPLLLFKEKL
ncbi:MAG: universal stress protein [Candidatus Pedobacter colombiensis]|uniref:Universal stress protein n=1 Tax=Candidatus Pedobacter colombiensis TaxID=3121371 RepID=A0AAJ5W578_9SPHI|nr:universal stress protein [Pedobacter sp.]WEK17795.1 MAG: universal stress protein [Pedobacter sp.]